MGSAKPGMMSQESHSCFTVLQCILRVITSPCRWLSCRCFIWHRLSRPWGGQPSLSTMTLKYHTNSSSPRGRLHGASRLDSKGSERQHLLATHSTSCTYSETLSECWVELTNVFGFAFVELFVETVRVFLNLLQYVHSLSSHMKHSYCIPWLRWLRYKFIKDLVILDNTRNII